MIKKFIHIFIGFTFLIGGGSASHAQTGAAILPLPGEMVSVSAAANGPVLKAIRLDPNNPFHFNFYIKRGSKELDQNGLQEQGAKLIRYFLAALTTPSQDMWVNLSPYEHTRVVPELFGQTEMGRDLLAQDYLLKQLTASLIYPEGDIGKKFWKKVYGEVQKKYGTDSVPMNTFNKVWILPDKAVVLEHNGSAVVVNSHLRVMLEEDYTAAGKHSKILPAQGNAWGKNVLAEQVIRETVIPALEKEVNEGENFAQLRQVFHSLILAAWYKKKIKESALNAAYANKNKIGGIEIAAGGTEKIYQQYVAAYKKGVFNYIKEEISEPGGAAIPRKYFSGGVAAAHVENTLEVITKPSAADWAAISGEGGNGYEFSVDISLQRARIQAGALKSFARDRIEKQRALGRQMSRYVEEIHDINNSFMAIELAFSMWEKKTDVASYLESDIESALRENVSPLIRQLIADRRALKELVEQDIAKRHEATINVANLENFYERQAKDFEAGEESLADDNAKVLYYENWAAKVESEIEMLQRLLHDHERFFKGAEQILRDLENMLDIVDNPAEVLTKKGQRYASILRLGVYRSLEQISSRESQELNQVEVDIGELLVKQLNMYSTAIPRQYVTLPHHGPNAIMVSLRVPEQPAIAYVDKNRLVRIVMNFIKNSRESMIDRKAKFLERADKKDTAEEIAWFKQVNGPDAGDIDESEQGTLNRRSNSYQMFSRFQRVIEMEIGLTANQDFLELKIKDTGEGIEESLLVNLLKGEGRTTKKEGTGVGFKGSMLSIMVQGGYINVQSKPGQGTAITTGFPVNESVKKKQIEKKALAGVVQQGDKAPASDQAQAPSSYGGIDFDDRNLNMDIQKGAGPAFQFEAGAAGLNPEDVQGVRLNILQITPVHNFPLLIGLTPPNSSSENPSLAKI